jgi:regulator of replication initiation timing
MEKEMIKKAVREAEDSLKQKQYEEVKKIVVKTLEKERKLEKEIADAKQEVKELEEQKKILKMDIDDLKEGRLDRIAERQEKDEKARKVSVVLIIKEKETIVERPMSPWYWPYVIVWEKPTYPSYPITVYGGSSSGAYIDSLGNQVTYTCSSNFPTITSSVAKDATIGAYEVNGSIVNLR